MKFSRRLERKALRFRTSVKVSHAPRCPTCGVGLDGCFAIDEEDGGPPVEHRPVPGSITLCAYCGQLLQFDEAMQLQKRTRAEIENMVGPDDVRLHALLVIRDAKN